MSYKPSDSATIEFVTSSSTGAAANADSTPTGTFARNGTDDGTVTVTVTNVDTGRYKAAFTIPAGAAAGDTCTLSIAATIGGVAAKGIVWQAVLDSARLADTPSVNASKIGGTTQTGLDLGGTWTAAKAAHLDADISSRMATFTLPTNFAALAITAGGIVQADLQTIKTQAVTCAGAVTILANVGTATHALVVDASGFVTVATNNDKTGYSLTQAFPANFAALSISVAGKINGVVLVDTCTTNTDMRGTDGAALASVWTAGEAAKLDTIYGKLPANNIADETLVIAATNSILTAVGTPQQAGVAVTLPAIPASWITSAGIAAAALNGKGDWNTVAPDNADILLIKAKTDNLPASPAAVGSLMGLADGAITDAKIVFPDEAAGRPTTFLAAMRRVWEWATNKRTRDTNTGNVALRNAADSATLETQTQSTVGSVDSQSQGV